MKRLMPLAFLMVLLVACSLVPGGQEKPNRQIAIPSHSASYDMAIASTAFENNGTIPVKYTCEGENINPPLSISNIPKNAKSFVLVMEDPDTRHFTWDHWVIFNVPPFIKEIPEGTRPLGVYGNNTRGKLDYIGPCPSDGTKHRYVFTVIALGTVLDLPEGVAKPAVEKAIYGNVLAQAVLVGSYDRQK